MQACSSLSGPAAEAGKVQQEQRTFWHATFALDRLSVRAVASDDWNSNAATKYSSNNGVALRIDQACVVLHQEPAAHGRPWLSGTNFAASEANVSVLGLAAKVYHGGRYSSIWHTPFNVVFSQFIL